jgi:CheY-like chemotaxis protein
MEDVTTEVDAGPARGGTETILVVEDDDEVRGTVVELLADLGYRVLKAKDAQCALAIIDSGAPIDLLFTDVVMPGPLRSPELARLARMRLPAVAVLFTSGYTDSAIVHGGRLDQGLELLSKPYTREALARKVRHVLRNQQQRTLASASAKCPACPPPSTDGCRPHSLKILFVEDDALIRVATADMLQGLGHAVFEAADAMQALRILEDTVVDVLLTDLGLPDMAGDRLAAEARRAKPGLKVIFATGADGVPILDAERGTEDALMLRKPYDLVALDSVLGIVAGFESVQ